MVPFLVVLLQDERFLLSLVVFVVAGITDGLDGYIAKHFNARTRLGALLDPLADKALLVSSYIMLSILELIPFWLMVVVVFRDVVIISGYLIMVLFFGSVEMKPLRISKLNTVLQIGFVVIVLAKLALGLHSDWLLTIMIYSVLVTSVLSGGAYVYIWSIRAMHSTDGIDTQP